jgi:hypothetical protein
MTRVSNADHVLLILREQLQRMGRGRAAATRRSGAAERSTERPLARLQQVAAHDQLSDEEFRRTLVRALLTEELGERLANDSAFEAVVDDVYRILGNSAEGRALLDGAARELRTAG